LALQGDDITVRNLAYLYFWEGVHMGDEGGSRQTLDNVRCENPGDDCVSNPPSPVGVDLVVRNSTFHNTCDKAIQMYGTPSAGRTNWDMTVTGCTFINSVQPVRAPYEGGRYNINNNRQTVPR
jgi:hypothetical protein